MLPRGANTPPHAVLQALAVGAADGEAVPFFREHRVLAIEPELQVGNVFDVDDVTAVNAKNDALWEREDGVIVLNRSF
jgi:uncharacterized protein (DUF2062 family)